jgi:hypothetical protein
MASSSIGIDPVGPSYVDSPYYDDEDSRASTPGSTSPAMQHSGSRNSVSRLAGYSAGAAGLAGRFSPEPDDFLHDPDPALNKIMDKQRQRFSVAAVIDTAALFIVVIVLIGLFAGWPIYRYAIEGSWGSHYMQTLVNSTGQVPRIPNLPSLVDAATPSDAYTRTGFDGKEYELVFSDEVRLVPSTYTPCLRLFLFSFSFFPVSCILTSFIPSFADGISLCSSTPTGGHSGREMTHTGRVRSRLPPLPSLFHLFSAFLPFLEC